MRHQPKSHILQLKFALLDLAPQELPSDRQSELTDALAELLLNAAFDEMTLQTRGGSDESEADQ